MSPDGQATSDGQGTADGQGPSSGDASTETETPPPRTFEPEEWLTHEAGPFTVPAHEERFFCYSFTLEEDIAVDEIVLDSRPVVHHVIYALTSSPIPKGSSSATCSSRTTGSPCS